MIELLKAIVELITKLIDRNEKPGADDLFKMPKQDADDPTVFIRKKKD